MTTKYNLTDGNAHASHDTLADAASSAEDWYGFLLDDGDASDELREAVDSADFGDVETVDALNERIGEWEDRIAAACSKKDFHGHGRYQVSAADQMGLALRCTEVR